MKRYTFEISYDGSSFFGWQRQPKQISVQEAIEQAFTKMNGLIPVSIVGCGRTDTGVHAKHYVFHVDLEEKLVEGDLKHKLNRMLPPSIAVHQFAETHPDFHARFDATFRTYRYFIHSEKNPFLVNQSLFFPAKLNLKKMNEAAQFLLGKQDFTSLSKLHTDVKTNICTVTKAEWVQVSDSEIYFEIQADRFLRNMVRATVGTLLAVGEDKLAVSEIPKILAKKDRGEAKISVPAQGLFLWEIGY